MSDTEQAAGRRGRPRDATIDARVRQATRQLLAGRGYAATTVNAIAATAGVPLSAIYRRWSSRIELIEDVVAPPVPEAWEPTGDLEADIARLDGALRSAFTTPEALAALPALLAEYKAGRTGRPPEEWWRSSWRPVFYRILEASGAEIVDADLGPDDLFDVMLGSILVQLFIPTADKRPNPGRRTVAVVCRLLKYAVTGPGRTRPQGDGP